MECAHALHYQSRRRDCDVIRKRKDQKEIRYHLHTTINTPSLPHTILHPTSAATWTFRYLTHLGVS